MNLASKQSEISSLERDRERPKTRMETGLFKDHAAEFP
jgi:hypothetical protein